MVKEIPPQSWPACQPFIRVSDPHPNATRPTDNRPESAHRREIPYRSGFFFVRNCFQKLSVVLHFNQNRFRRRDTSTAG